jgi:peptidyl-prolyl cis-trans isomerase C
VAEAASRLEAVRGRILERARALAIAGESEEAVIEAVLDHEVAVPSASEAECRWYYDAHPGEFQGGAAVFASHILFAVTPGAPVEAIRRKAEEALAAARERPDTFGALARELSNCPSGAQGGDLGPLVRGETVPEFERAIFDGNAVGVLPRLVATRHGFHVIRVDRREPGRLLPFEAVHEALARHLEETVRARALRQYVSVLEGGSPLTR